MELKQNGPKHNHCGEKIICGSSEDGSCFGATLTQFDTRGKERNCESGLPYVSMAEREMHITLKEMETLLVELKAVVALLSTKIDLLSARGNRAASPKPKIGLNQIKENILGCSPIPLTKRRVCLVKRRIASFKVGSTLSISIEMAKMERPPSQVTPLVSVYPKETMALAPELKKNGVTLRLEGDVGSVKGA